MKAMGDVDTNVHIFTATALARGMLASPRPFLPPRKPRYSFYMRLSGPQDQSGNEGVKKNIHPSDTRNQARVPQPVAKRLTTHISITCNL